MRFKYKDKIYETPNLEKKLTRMRISLDLIEILPDEVKKVESNIPAWREEGKIKYTFININPDSSDYLHTIIGVCYPKEDITLNTNWVNNINDWKLKSIEE